MTRVALYARYSDDKQSPHSIDDQFRICRMHADKQAWEVVETYSDAAISGSTVILRPGLQALLRDALAGKFDLVLAEALDRLSRDQEDIAGAYKRLRFAGVPIVTLSEGEITELHVGLKGTMNALFLKDLAAKTHRGIRGRVEAGKVGCGNAYGYRVVREIDATGRVTTGEREIVPEEAEVVRRIFRDYAAGKSPRRIAIELNAEGVPAPWGSKWCDSSIRGNRALGSGIINNEFYVGEMIWNRRRRMKNPDTGRVEPRFNPESEWVHVQAPHLRIIEDGLWQAARRRQDSLVHVYEANMAKSRTAAASANRRPKTLLSGLLVCGVCGGSAAKRGNNRFGCVSHIMGKGCTNTRTVNRDALEARVIAGLRDSLMAPEVISEAMRTMVEETNRLNQQRRASRDVDVQRLEKARKAIAGIVAAIEDGGYSRPLMEQLRVLEAEVEVLEAQMAETPADVPDVHPNVANLYRRKVERLIEALDRPEDHDHAAQALRAVIDSIVVTPGEKRGEVLVQLLGDFRKVIAWATERQAAGREPDEASSVEALSVARASRAGMTDQCNERKICETSVCGRPGRGKRFFEISSAVGSGASVCPAC
ncbi:recombinase family protein [Caulobacter sp. Root1472]|uniref:recombinase family protein n=1 Tax=Caulobacter sp. Root1472 TaxID=1736470 RepID=UPI0009E67229|nr:recombinase family protein [Caulobacter sp. Root1472]